MWRETTWKVQRVAPRPGRLRKKTPKARFARKSKENEEIQSMNMHSFDKCARVFLKPASLMIAFTDLFHFENKLTALTCWEGSNKKQALYE